MIFRFCLYSVLKNLRFADPFLAIFMIELGFSYTQIGAMLGFEKLITALFEVPSGYAADRVGRRSVLAWSFACHALGLSVLAMAAQANPPHPFWFYVGLGVFGLGEAFRTGSHKAIMLDYLELSGRIDESTLILGLARTYSKASSALAGIIAGALLFVFKDYSLLFWLSTATAVAGCLLTLSYPKSLEGEGSRERDSPSVSTRQYLADLIGMLRNPRLWPLLLQSLVYESQVEIVLKLFLQPFLHQGLTTAGFALPPVSGDGGRSVGSVLVGVNELFRDGIGAIGARRSGRAERNFRSRARALYVIFLSTTLVVGLLAITAVNPGPWLVVGLCAIGAATYLQNLRRPMFVSQLDEVANKSLRATILSIDSQTRSLLVAFQLPLMGLTADTWGLWTVATVSAACMLAALGTIRPYSEQTHKH